MSGETSPSASALRDIVILEVDLKYVIFILNNRQKWYWYWLLLAFKVQPIEINLLTTLRDNYSHTY